MNIRFVFLFCMLALTCSALADVREIHFSLGSSSAVLSDAVVRGTRHVFSFEARKGQATTIIVTSTENNAAIAIWRPGANVHFGEFVEIEGQTLLNAGEENDTRKWSGRLPESGVYLIVVGPTRGNATYKLTVMIGK